MIRKLHYVMLFALVSIGVQDAYPQLIPVRTEDLIRQSESIVKVKVTDTNSRWVNGEEGKHIITVANIHVDSVIRGTIAKTDFSIEFLGGTVGDTTESVSHSLFFKAGEELVLFLHLDPIRVAGGIQGKLNIINDQLRFDGRLMNYSKFIERVDSVLHKSGSLEGSNNSSMDTQFEMRLQVTDKPLKDVPIERGKVRAIHNSDNVEIATKVIDKPSKLPPVEKGKVRAIPDGDNLETSTEEELKNDRNDAVDRFERQSRDVRDDSGLSVPEGGKPGQISLPSSIQSVEPAVDAEKKTGKKILAPQETDKLESAGWETIFSDGFEGAFPGEWKRFRGDADAYWDGWQCWSSEGSWSAGSVAGGSEGIACGDNYPNDVNTWLEYGPFSLSDTNITDAQVNFDFKLSSEPEYDYFWVVASKNGTDYYGYRWSGSYEQSYNFDLTDVPQIGSLLGESEVWIAFVFQSDGSVTYSNGAQVDNVVIRKYVGSPPNLIADYTPSGWDYPIVPSNVTGTNTVGDLTAGTTYVDLAFVNRNADIPSDTRFFVYLYLAGDYVHGWWWDGIQQDYYGYVEDYLLPFSVAPGDHALRTFVDAEGDVIESDETDNEYERTFTWESPVGAPNLIADYTPSGWDYPIVPSNVTGTNSVGDLTAGTTYIDFAFVNRNSDISTDSFYVYLYAAGNYVAGWYWDGIQQDYYGYVEDYLLPFSVAPGDHALRTFVDAEGDVIESDETDNEYEHTFTWQTPLAAPYITSISPDKASAGTNTMVSIGGGNFGASQDSSMVQFFFRHGQGRIEASISSWSDTQIEGPVPRGTSSGDVEVITAADTSNDFTFKVSFGYGGVSWPGIPVHYKVNGNLESADGEITQVGSAAETWNNAGAAFSLAYDGTTSVTVSSRNGVNEVLWGSTSSGALAQVHYWYTGSSLIECDMVFSDDENIHWSTDDTPANDEYDVQSIGLHEFGHFLLLLDLYGDIGDGVHDVAKVMYGYGTLGALKRSLHVDDVAGIQWIYGTGNPPVVADIPDLTISMGESFTPIELDDYVGDPDHSDSEMTWSTTGTDQLSVQIDDNRVATVSAPSDWSGSETVRFTATDPDGLSDSDKARFTVYRKAEPVMHAVEDIPEDQGGYVGITLAGSIYDCCEIGYDISHYSVWREMDFNRFNSLISSTSDVRATDFNRFSNLITSTSDLGPTRYFITDTTYWEYLDEFPAVGFEHYAYTAPTILDSSETGTHWNTYLVIAHVDGLDTLFVSEPDSGYSVDNLAPQAPGGVVASMGEEGIDLSWEMVPDEDFNYYGVYRSTEGGFDPGVGDLYETTIDTFFLDREVETNVVYYYRVSAFDFSGNEGEFSEEVSASTMGVQALTELPTVFSLAQNYPNPFNPVTTLRYGLPERTHVVVRIYDILGRPVRTLVMGVQEPGFKTVEWSGTDDIGEAMSAGVYLYQMQAGNFTQTRKMILLK